MPLSLGPIEQTAEFSLNDRSHLTYPVLLGRRFMMDIAVTDISQNYSSPRPEFPGGEPAASAALHGLNLDSTILNFSTHSLPLEEQARFIDLPCVSPDQDTLLQLSAACYEMTGLGYIGADIALDRVLGPMLLALDARPGLGIQMANGEGLKGRLDLIEQQPEGRNVEERLAFSVQHFSRSTPAVAA